MTKETKLNYVKDSQLDEDKTKTHMQFSLDIKGTDQGELNDSNNIVVLVIAASCMSRHVDD